MATGTTIGQQMAELIEWAANGRPDPRPKHLDDLESEDPDGHARTLAALNLFMTACHDKEEALAKARTLAAVR